MTIVSRDFKPQKNGHHNLPTEATPREVDERDKTLVLSPTQRMALIQKKLAKNRFTSRIIRDQNEKVEFIQKEHVEDGPAADSNDRSTEQVLAKATTHFKVLKAELDRMVVL